MDVLFSNHAAIYCSKAQACSNAVTMHGIMIMCAEFSAVLVTEIQTLVLYIW